MVKGGRGLVACVVGDECGRVCNNVTEVFYTVYGKCAGALLWVCFPARQFFLGAVAFCTIGLGAY